MKLAIADVLKFGVAPNKDYNTTLAVAEQAKTALEPFLPVVGAFVNLTMPTGSGAAAPPFIDVSEYDIPADAKLFYVIALYREGWNRHIGAADFGRGVEAQGMHNHVVSLLNTLDPTWDSEDGKPVEEIYKIRAKREAIAALPGKPKPPEAPEVDASPDFNSPLNGILPDGVAACRLADKSLVDTEWTSPTGAVWVKILYNPWMHAWKRK